MTFWSRLRSWVKAILRRSRMESDMDAELRFHIEAFAEDLVSAGVPRSEALRRARRSCNRRQDRSAANHLTLDFGVPTHHHLPPVSRRGHPTVRQQHAPGASPGTSAELSIQSPLGKAGSHGRRNPCRHRRKGEQLSVHVFEDFSDSLFQEDATANLDQQVAPDDRPPQPLPAMRSSKSRFEMLPFALIEKQNLANDLAAFGLLLARSVLDTVPQVAWHPAILVAWNTGEIRLALRNSSLPEPPLRSTLGIGTGRAAACVSARNCLERQANRRRRSDQARTS